MTASPSIVSRQIRKIIAKIATDCDDAIAIEEPLEIQISYVSSGKRSKKNISVTMRTPGQDEELAVGFLFTEGIITNTVEVKRVYTDILEDNKVAVVLTDSAIPKLPSTERNFYTTSSCGVCGKASIDAIRTVSAFANESGRISVSSDTLVGLAPKLVKEQQIFGSTGGLHASAIFDCQGNFIALREDVGRHNALDKLIGSLFLKNALPLSDKILLLSGRASFELIQKAVMAGVKIVAAIGAPSSLAVEMAEESGITLIGFLKNDRFNIYTGAERITDL